MLFLHIFEIFSYKNGNSDGMSINHIRKIKDSDFLQKIIIIDLKI